MQWFTQPTEPSSDLSADAVADLNSENSNSTDTVHCIIAEEEIFEDHTACTSTNIKNDDFIDLASQVVGNSLTVTDSGPIDTDLDSIHLQDDTAGTSVAGTISNQQETSLISDDAIESSVPGNTTLWCYCQQDKTEELMVGCDNPTCQIEWFHLSCLRLTVEQLSRGKWFFPSVASHGHS